MPNLRPLSRRIALALTMIAGPVAAYANGSCNGYNRTGTYFENRTNIYSAGGPHLEGETVTFTVTGNFTSFMIDVSGDQSGTLCSSATACNGFVFTAPMDGTYTFALTGTGGAGIGPGPSGSTVMMAGEATATCMAREDEVDEDEGEGDDDTTEDETDDDTTEDEGEGDEGRASKAAAAASNSAAATGGAAVGAIGNAISTGTSTTQPFTATRNALTFSTAGGAPDAGFNAWGTASYRSFDGGVDGDGFEFTLGLDGRLSAATRLGFVVSYGDYSLTSGGNAISTQAFSFGPYLKVDITDTLALQAFALLASPDYAISGTRFTADRRAGGLKLSSTYRLGQVELTSSINAEGFVEDHPALVIGGAAVAGRSISSFTGAVGTKATFNPDSALRPYLSLAAQYNHFDDGLGATRHSVSPRVGAGLTFNGDMGDIDLHIEAGEVFDGTRDYAIRFGYSLEF